MFDFDGVWSAFLSVSVCHTKRIYMANKEKECPILIEYSLLVF
jgi:hypothetical protein